MDILDLRHEPSWAKWRKDLRRNDPPPFLGPLVTIKEAMEALNRSENYVRSRIEDGRLNTWKDPISKRVWILKDDLDILIGDNRALEEAGKITRRQSGPRKPANPESEIDNPQSEDLDAIGGWEHPKPPEIIGGATIEESARESQVRYEQAQRENEEWYAAELAKLEDRNPEVAVRQLRIERGWETRKPEEPEIDPGSFDSVYEAAKEFSPATPSNRKHRQGTAEVVRPISWSNPNRFLQQPVEPYDDPDFAAPSFADPIVPPFPVGWVGHKDAAAILQVSIHHFPKLVRKHKLQRRRAPTGRRRYLYDTVELESVAEQRLESRRFGEPGKRLDWWGSRRVKMELNEFNYWITPAEAATILECIPAGLANTATGGSCHATRKSPASPAPACTCPTIM